MTISHKNKLAGVLLPQHVAERFALAAVYKRRSRSEIVRGMVIDWLRAHAPDTKVIIKRLGQQFYEAFIWDGTAEEFEKYEEEITEPKGPSKKTQRDIYQEAKKVRW